MSRLIDLNVGAGALKNVSHMLDNYQRHFEPYQDREIVLLELGIYEGGSLRLWEEFFPKGSIIGVDCNRGDRSYGRITEYGGQQQDIELLSRIAAAHAPDGFDIIIDDCSHVGSLTRTSFIHLFYKHLKSGGLYSVEDWGVSYEGGSWEGEPYAGKNHLFGIVGFVKDRIDTMQPSDKWEGPIESVTFYQEQIIFRKR